MSNLGQEIQAEGMPGTGGIPELMSQGTCVCRGSASCFAACLHSLRSAMHTVSDAGVLPQPQLGPPSVKKCEIKHVATAQIGNTGKMKHARAGDAIQGMGNDPCLFAVF